MAGQNKWLRLFQDFVADIRIVSKEVISDDPRGTPLVLWESQRRFIKNVGEGLDDGIHIFNCLKSRQLGVTTISLALLDVFWLAMHDNMIGALVTDTDENKAANRILIRKYVNGFPEGYFGGKFEIVDDNRNLLTFSNGSTLRLLVAGTKKKSLAWAEGTGYTLLHITECAKYANPDGLKSLFEGFAQVNPHRLAVLESTANGYNHWKSRYDAGCADPYTQRSFFIGWWSGDNNRIEKSDPRFRLWGKLSPDKDEREKIAAVAKLYQWQVSPEQLAWIRWKESDAGRDQDLLQQNQPWCLVANTRVGTNRGIIPICEVIRGDINGFGTVYNSGPTGVAEIWRAKTKLGYEIEGTANHPLIDINDREVELKNSCGCRVQLRRPLFADGLSCSVLPPPSYIHRWREGVIDHSVEITPEFARLVGLYMGDGSLSGSPRAGYQFAITCDSKDQDIIKEAKRLIETLFGVNAQLAVYREVGDGGWTAVRTTSKLVYDTFRSLGLATTENGRTQRVVHVPEFIWRSPKHVVKEFLSGLFEADGHASKAQEFTVFASKHKQFVQDVQLLLLGFGITCRTTPTLGKIKKNNNDRVYSSVRMELRTSETRLFNQVIGFLSNRKLNIIDRRRVGTKNPRLSVVRAQPIVMEDEIVSVENTGRIEEVYNLTVEAPHWFDANGIVTHNTAQDAFVQSGRSFFAVRVINKDLKKREESIKAGESTYRFDGYKYVETNTFLDFYMVEELEDLDLVELKIWEEPKPNGKYAIGFDVAYGRNDHKDGNVIEVFRCFADCLVQVAEYATYGVDVRYASWVFFHLCAAYGDVMGNIEIGGPGRLVMQEFAHLRELLGAEHNQERVKTRNWQDATANARWYLYHKPDQPQGGYVYNFETNWSTKRPLMHTYASSYITNCIEIRSRQLLDEMTIVQDNDGDIGAPDSTDINEKDDRVFSAALAHKAWVDWIRSDMLAQGQTFERVMKDERGEIQPITRVIDNIVYKFLAKQEDLANQEPERGTEWQRRNGLV